MEIILECNKAELLFALKKLRVALPKNNKEKRDVRLMLTVSPGKIFLSVIGATYSVDCKTNIFGKVFVPFMYFSEMIRNWKEETFFAHFEHGKFTFGTTVFRSSLIEVIHSENQSAIELSMNYTQRDLLRLRSQYSSEELLRLNLVGKIEKAEEEKMEKIYQAASLLKVYGVTVNDIEQLVELKLEEDR